MPDYTLNDTNSIVRYSIARNADVYQRRPKRDYLEHQRESPRTPLPDWANCCPREAREDQNHQFEYRALMILPDEGKRVADDVVVVKKPSLDGLDETDREIIRFIDRQFKRSYAKDEGEWIGWRPVKNHIKLSKDETKRRLNDLTARGHLRHSSYGQGGSAWRSINLLPYEVKKED